MSSGTASRATDDERAAIDLVAVSCPLCGRDEAAATYSVRDHEYESTPRMAFTLRRCAGCSLYYLSPRPALHELDKIYPPDYADHDTEQKPARGALDRLRRQLSVRAISNRLQLARYRALLDRYAGITPSSTPRVLDAGCGDGHKLNLIKAIVPGAITIGVEISGPAARRAAEHHTVITGDFLDVELPGQFDLIVSSHVIEHVADPLRFLQRIERLLAPNGVAIIDTPNIDTPLFRLFGRHWGGIHAPRHWVLFSRETLTALAKRAGLDVRDVIYMPIQVFGIWSVHSLLYERMPGLAARFFDPQACVNRPSLYYTALMSAFDAAERAVGLVQPRLGQMRLVLARAAN